MTQSTDRLAQWLREQAEEIRRLETEARGLLDEQGDKAGYTQKLKEKCFLLQALPEQAEPLLEGVPETIRMRVRLALENYAMRAGQALEIGSIFFMSALLYPDDYQDGEPNEFERMVASLG